jgi:beta-glucosidase
MQAYEFPPRFLWGASTAAHQVEGNNINSELWRLEHMPGTIFAEPSGDACDHYHRYAEDIALLASLGFNAFRFSLEWARIEPEEGMFSRAELDHYRRVLSTCHEHGITPVVTLHHFTSPQWLIREGGWLDDRTPDRYLRYCEQVVAHLGDLIGAACTFNEVNIGVLLERMLPSPITSLPFWKKAAEMFGVSADRLGLYQFVSDPRMHEIIYRAHHRARDILQAGPGQFPVGMTLAMMDLTAAPGGEANLAQYQHELADIFLEPLRGDDFVGVQTYSRLIIGPDGIVPPPPEAELNQMGEEFYPEAIGGTIRHAAQVTGLPVIVTENGVAAEDDTRRVEYLKRAVRSVAEAMASGVDVRGYFCWSALDNFEWISGYTPKFGLIHVDRQTMKRTPRPSACWLGNVAKNNRIEFD